MVVCSIRAIYFDDTLLNMVLPKVAVDCDNGTAFAIREGRNPCILGALP